MKSPRTAVAALAAVLAAGDAFGQDGAAPPAADYRWALYTACTVAFAAIVVFLVLTHAKARRAAEEISSLERRLDALEGRGGSDGR